MKKISHYFNLLLIGLAVFHFSINNSLSQSIIGPLNVCINSTVSYTVPSGSSDPSQWTFSPAGSFIFGLDINTISVTWTTPGIVVLSNPSMSISISVNVVEFSPPVITYDNLVGCQEEDGREDEFGVIIVDPALTCITVCEGSTVIYSAITTVNWLNSNPSYHWSVSGGLITHAGGQVINPVTSYTGDISNVAVEWGSPGNGLIVLEEICPFGVCPNTQSQLCIKVIERPTASFNILLAGSVFNDPENCLQICPGTTLYFQDVSITNSNSQLISWYWEWGDNTLPSVNQNPYHEFNVPGDHTITLIITNECYCTDTFQLSVCVEGEAPPVIECRNVVCENDYADYQISPQSACQYPSWIIEGGSIIGSNNDPTVTVLWDDIGPDGFGYIGLDAQVCGYSCPTNQMIQIPVILSEGTIVGPNTICVNESYFFELPAWPATDFEWEIINDVNTQAEFNSLPSNGYRIELNAGAVSGTIILQCSYKNTFTIPACTGFAQIEILILPKPEILGDDKICAETDYTCTLSAGYSSPSTSWKLIKPDGQTSTMTGSNAFFSHAHFINPGLYTIEASNPTIFCDPNDFSLNVVLPPIPVTTINGDILVCNGYPNAYSISTPIPNTIVYWSVLNGNINGLPYGTNSSITWNIPIASSGMIFVSRAWEDLPSCLSQEVDLEVEKIQMTGNIETSYSVFCEDAVFDFHLNSPYQAETYEWSIQAGSQVGSISSGQGTESCEVTFLHLGAVANCSIKLVTTKCGSTETFLYPLTINNTAEIDNLQISPSPACSGEEIEFIVTSANGSPLQFFWDFNDGTVLSTQLTGQNTSEATHVFQNTTGQSIVYPINVQVQDGCNNFISDVYQTNLTVYTSPNASLSPIIPFAHCGLFQSTPIVVSCNPGTNTYEWYFNEGTPGDPGYQIANASTNTYYLTPSPPSLIGSTATTCDGEYYCIITNTTTGCSDTTDIKQVFTLCASPCDPIPPFGFNSVQGGLIGCAQAQVTCTILGTLGVNLVSYEWYVDADPSNYTASGSGTISQSPVYSFIEAGVYIIGVRAEYLNAISGQPNCFKDTAVAVIVEYVPSFEFGVSCGANGTSYDILLQSLSSIFPGQAVTHTWTDPNNPGFSSNNTSSVYNVAPGNVYTIELALTGGTYSCQIQDQVDIPDLPIAAFEMVTTYGNPMNPHRSCENREIQFINQSTPQASIVSNEWDFGDVTYSLLFSPFKTYDVNSSMVVFEPIITITDKFGCVDSEYDTLFVFQNKLEYNISNPYQGAGVTLCQGLPLPIPISPNFQFGASPFTYQWYNQEQIINSSILPTLSGIVSNGAYWVQITDANYCILNVNPSPAIVTNINPPTAIIEGDLAICEGDDILLSAISGLPPLLGNIEYNWIHHFGMSQTGLSGKEISVSQPVYSNNVFDLSVVDLATGCESTPVSVEVLTYNNPIEPDLYVNMVQCELWQIDLSATVNWPYQSSITWSNGMTGNSIQIYSGGAYRAWVIDEHGCKNYKDTVIPIDPSYYFWRYPAGCYIFCEEELPLQVNGPNGVIFRHWQWNKDQDPVTNNGIYLPQGDESESDPLVIDVPTNGDGPGEYSWLLAQEVGGVYCEKTSEILSWQEGECCELSISEVDITCGDKPGKYEFVLHVSFSGCAEAFGNLALVTDDGSPVFNVYYNPTLLVDGNNVIYGSFELSSFPPTASQVTFTLYALCEGGCSYDFNIILPTCQYKNNDQQNDAVLIVKEFPTLKVLPNPAANQFSILYNLPESICDASCEKVIKLTNYLGISIVERNVYDSQGNLEFNVSDCKNGIYFIELFQCGLRIGVEKVLILK